MLRLTPSDLAVQKNILSKNNNQCYLKLLISSCPWCPNGPYRKFKICIKIWTDESFYLLFLEISFTDQFKKIQIAIVWIENKRQVHHWSDIFHQCRLQDSWMVRLIYMRNRIAERKKIAKTWTKVVEAGRSGM